MLDFVLEQTEKYLCSKTKSERKVIGQFFTSKETAIFMAGLFDIPRKSSISILDPGAGTGILSAALLKRLQHIDSLTNISLTCYENEPETFALLHSNLQYIKSRFSKPFEFEIVEKNYVTCQQDDFNKSLVDGRRKYDLIIGNPPYKKISKDAPEAVAMPLVCHGAPNLYFLFCAMSMFNLKDGGEIVYIIPRSWTSGAYFKAFRNYMLSEGRLTNIHLFVSRDKVFDYESVLQETIIVKFKKQRASIDFVNITSTKNNYDFNDITRLRAPYSVVVSGRDNYVFLATCEEELSILEKLEKLEDTLFSIGCKMKTGLTVDFRSTDLLRSAPGEKVVPLFYPQHIKNGAVIFPAHRDNEFILDEQPGLIQRNRNYLFVKRFTSKEEHRRLQSGIYLSSNLPEYEWISTENKLNFIDSTHRDGLSEEMVYGLYVLFNSTIYDTYYRILNGSTQVNSTEVNSMPVPAQNQIRLMGRLLQQSDDLSVGCCDNILMEVLR